ncbi:MAG TPA: hypothetical protein VE131_08880, partial [Terriglobales bacterium]|nr:hypothetical protein [Terriglobales bacterium]
ILGLAERQVLYDLSNAVIQGNARRCLELIANVVAEGGDLGRLARDLVEHFRNLLVVRLIQARGRETEDRDFRSSVPNHLLDLPDQEVEDLRAQVADLSIETLLDYFDFMAAGDEDVNRSSNPRFALETVLVRLATLPKTLPITELLERLEKLEKRLPESGQASSALAAPEETPKQQVIASDQPAAVSFAGDQEELWRRFVSFVGKEKKFLGSHLEGGRVLELPPGQLRIGVTERHHLNYLQDPDHLSLLKSLAQRFFGNEVPVVITSADPQGIARKDEATGAGALSPEDQGSTTVREALRIFGGSIKTVRRESG